ncbi:MAG TPA: MotA/TolQ/ExbB proton channel family protein [Alphaproteobacteria bacterium]|nr:MotA/TolQ/ExbB proton channel family protein [Alphaproteobacteria bacterium]
MALVMPAAPAAPRAPIAPVDGTETVASEPQRLAWLAQAARGELDPRRHLLLLRCAVINLVALALFGAGWVQGYIDVILAADDTYLCTLIFLIFLGGWIMALWRIAETSRELALVRQFNPLVPSLAARYLAQVHGRAGDGRAQATTDLRLKLAHRMGLVRHVANNLVLVGLIGTVLGFIISLAGVDPDRAQEASSISPMVAKLIEGMSVALYTTLVGSVLHIWLMVNYHMLATGTVELVTAIAELGERHARS